MGTRGALQATLAASPQLDALLSYGPTATRVSLSGNGRVLAVAHANGTIDFRDPRTGDPTAATLRVGRNPGVMALSSDGHTIATSDLHGTIVVRDVATGKARGQPLTGLEIPELRDLPYNPIMFSPDGSKLAGVLSPIAVLVWDLRETHPVPWPIYEPPPYERLIGFPAWSPDSRLLAIGDTAEVNVWDVVTRRPIQDPIIAETGGAIPSVAFNSAGDTLAVGEEAGSVKLLGIHGPNLVDRGRVVGLTKQVTAIGFSADDNTLIAGDAGRVVIAWSLETGTPERLGAPLVGLSAAVDAVVFERGRSTDRRHVVLKGAQNLGVWHLDPTPSIGTFLPVNASLERLSPDGTTLAMLGLTEPNGKITRISRYDMVKKRMLAPLSVNLTFQFQLAWSPDAKQWALAGEDGWVTIMETATGVVVERLPAGDKRLRAVAFSPDGHLLAAVGDDGTVHLWDAVTRRPVGSPLRVSRSGPIFTLAFSPDSHQLAVGTVELGLSHVHFVDAASQRTLHTVAIAQPVFGVAFSPDGATLAAGLYDGSVVLLDAATGRRNGPALPGHGSWVFGVAYSRDGTQLATTAYDGTVIVRDVATGQAVGDPLELGPGLHLNGGVFNPSFSRDGRTLITGHLAAGLVGGRIVLWDVDASSWRHRACVLAGRNLTHAEFVQYLPGRVYRKTCDAWPIGT